MSGTIITEGPLSNPLGLLGPGVLLMLLALAVVGGHGTRSRNASASCRRGNISRVIAATDRPGRRGGLVVVLVPRLRGGRVGRLRGWLASLERVVMMVMVLGLIVVLVMTVLFLRSEGARSSTNASCLRLMVVVARLVIMLVVVVPLLRWEDAGASLVVVFVVTMPLLRSKSTSSCTKTSSSSQAIPVTMLVRCKPAGISSGSVLLLPVDVRSTVRCYQRSARRADRPRGRHGRVCLRMLRTARSDDSVVDAAVGVASHALAVGATQRRSVTCGAADAGASRAVRSCGSILVKELLIIVLLQRHVTRGTESSRACSSVSLISRAVVVVLGRS